MPLARTFDGTRIVSTLRDGYLDRLSKWSDIQEYLPFLHETAKSYKKVRVLELGARKGNSTLAFLAAAEATDGHVTSGDIDNIAMHKDGMFPWRKNPRWTFIHGHDMDPAVQAQLPDEVDVFFLDTSHEYGHTLAELRAYMPRVASGGIALFHDTNKSGWGGNPPLKDVPEVAQALDAYCEETGLSWENLPGEFGLGVIGL